MRLLFTAELIKYTATAITAEESAIFISAVTSARTNRTLSRLSKAI